MLLLLRNPLKKEYTKYISKVPSNTYFNHFNSNYNNERLLYELVLTEGYNKHGVCCSYYTISYNTKYDKVFGEDNNRRVERKFKFMAYFDLPYETKTFTNMGIGWSDIFHVFVSMKHFRTASTLDYTTNTSAYPSYLPKVGDILLTEYNNVFYEIISVKSQAEQFLQFQHSWDFVVRVIRDTSLSFDPSTSATTQDLSEYMNTTDLFDIGPFINENKGPVLYEPSVIECGPKDPFNGWWE